MVSHASGCASARSTSTTFAAASGAGLARQRMVETAATRHLVVTSWSSSSSSVSQSIQSTSSPSSVSGHTRWRRSSACTAASTPHGPFRCCISPNWNRPPPDTCGLK